MPGFLKPLRLEDNGDGTWTLLDAFTFHLGAADGKWYVNVPAGSKTDYASVPRLLWNILPPHGSHGKAAVVHDFLYSTPEITDGTITKRVSRADADSIFLEGMEVLSVAVWRRQAMYYGVRAGGWKPWGEYRAREREAPKSSTA